MSGVFILTLATVIVKIIGLVYKIPMLRLVGSEGMGYFNSAYEIYTLFCVISTAGLPVAMSVMISSAEARGCGGVKKIFRVSFRTFLILGSVGTALMLLLASSFSEFIRSDNAYFCILAISPTVLFICLSSAYRGYFQGKGKMTPTAISQVIEAAGKLVLGIIFAISALRAGFDTEIVAAFAVLGLTLGTAISVLYLFLYKKFCDARQPKIQNDGNLRSGGIFVELMRTALPVTLSSAVISATKLIDMSMILIRLQSIGYDSVTANSVYGSYTTLALPLFSLAPAFITAVALPLVPSLSAFVASGEREEQSKMIRTALTVTVVLATPVSVGLALFSEKILSLMFPGELEAVATAAPLLCVLSVSVLLSCLITVTNAILQAYGHPSLPILSMAAGALIKIVLAYFLIGNPDVGIMGAPVSTFFCDLTITGINFYFVGRYAPRMPEVGALLVKPFICSALSVGGAYILLCVAEKYFGESKLSTLATIAVAAIAYFVFAFIFKALNEEDIEAVPGGDRLLRIYKKGVYKNGEENKRGKDKISDVKGDV